MKRLLSLTLLLASITVSAQTFTCSRIALTAMDRGAEFDFDAMQDAKNNVVLEIQEYSASGGWNTILDIGRMLRNMSGVLTIPTSLANTTMTVGTPAYTLKEGKKYCVHYKIPEDFTFKYMCHNNYGELWIRILGINTSGRICYRQTIASVPYNQTLQGTYWQCYGTGAEGYERMSRNGSDIEGVTFYLSENEWDSNIAQSEACEYFISVSLSNAY